jgi:hypothetical protein
MRSSSPRRTDRSSACAFEEIVARQREQPALGHPGDGVTRSTDALQESRDPMRRPDLAHEVDRSDVDAELERRRRHERLQLAALEPRLGVEPLVLRQAAVMGRDRLVAETIAQ